MRHHLVRWRERYANDGLVVIEINQSIGAPLEKMRQMVHSKHVEHAVLWDERCRNTKAYGITAWPFVYFIGADGTVFWEGNPARWLRRDDKRVQMQDLIERKLAEVGR